LSKSLLTAEELVEKAKRYNPDADSSLIQRAYEFAATAHAGQRRRSGEFWNQHST